MRRIKLQTWMILIAGVVLAVGMAVAETGSWTGEVIDVTCYRSRGSHGEGHASCGKRCVKSGEPMGLLGENDTLMLLEADADDPAPHEALMDLVGQEAEVSGTLVDRDGTKVVIVTAAKAAG